MGQTRVDRELNKLANSIHGDGEYAARSEGCALPIKNTRFGRFSRFRSALRDGGGQRFQTHFIFQKNIPSLRYMRNKNILLII